MSTPHVDEPPDAPDAVSDDERHPTDRGPGRSEDPTHEGPPPGDDGSGPESKESREPEEGDWALGAHINQVRGESFWGNSFEIGGNRSIHNDTTFNNAFHFGVTGSIPLRALRRSDFETRSRDDLRRAEETLIADGQVDAVLEHAERDRFVIVTGERCLGKGALCTLVAARLADRDERIEQALLSTGYEPSVRWEPQVWFGEKGEYAGAVVIFEDLLEEASGDLRSFFRRLDAQRLAALSAALHDADSYLLISADPTCLAENAKRLDGLGVRCAIEAPEEVLLLRALYRRLNRWQGDPERSEWWTAAEELLDDRATWLAARLRTLPRAVFFVDHLLIGVVRDDVELAKAIDSLEDAESWLLTDLPEKKTHWSFVLALVLASTDSRERWVPWSLFHRLWRGVEDRLSTEQRWWKDDEERPLDRMKVDDHFLRITRAEVRTRAFPAGQAVRFVARETVDGLWRVLTGPGRAVLAILQPLATEWMAAEDVDARELGARMLGRFGELEPERLVRAQVERQLSEEQGDERIASIVVGAVSTGNQAYVDHCFELVRSAAADQDVSREPRKLRKMRALRALAWIGAADPERVLKIVEGLLTTRLETLDRRLASASRKVEKAVERRLAEEGKQSPAEYESEKWLPRCLNEILLPEDARGSLFGCRFILVGLVFGGHATRVFGALTSWLERDEPTVTPWITLTSLRKGGVLEAVERFPVSLSWHDPESDGERSETCSRILIALEGAEDVKTLARFLEVSYAKCPDLPPTLRVAMRRLIVETLTAWLAQGAVVPPIRDEARAIFRCLLAGPEASLREEVFELLRRASKERDDEQRERTAELALDILRADLLGLPDEVVAELPAG